MMNKLSAFISTLGTYDYLLFGGGILLFILLLLAAILLHERLALALMAIVMAFASILLVPTLGYKLMHEIVYKHTFDINEIRKLEFTQAVVIKGTLMNTSNNDITACTITAEAYKVTGNALLDTLYTLKPFQKGTIITQPVPIGQQIEFKLFIEPFTYTDEYNTTIGALCR